MPREKKKAMLAPFSDVPSAQIYYQDLSAFPLLEDRSATAFSFLDWIRRNGFVVAKEMWGSQYSNR